MRKTKIKQESAFSCIKSRLENLVTIHKNRVANTWLKEKFQGEHVLIFRRDHKLHFNGFVLRKIPKCLQQVCGY